MSSYIVDYKTIDRILSWINNNQNSTAIGSFCADDLESFGKKLLLMNTKAVNQRYEEKSDEKHAKSYKFKKVKVYDCQALKSAECLYYQCSEGNVPGMKLYKSLRSLIEIMRNFVIEKLPAYTKAEWG